MYRIFLIFYCFVGHLEANCLANTPIEGSTSSSVGTTVAQAIKCSRECLVSPVGETGDTGVTGYIEKSVQFPDQGCEVGCKRIPDCGMISFQVKLTSGEIIPIMVQQSLPKIPQVFRCDDNELWIGGGGKIKNITQFICSYEPTGC